MTPKKDDDMIKHEIVNERLDSTTSTDSQQLTLLEKKHVLINREIDANGMGRYQWYMWSLCGFGYLLDLQWAQAFGLVLGPLSQELGISAHSSGNISIAFSAGLTAGTLFWGVMVDTIGRRWAFNLTCLISAVFGITLGGCNSYDSFLIVTAFVGFGIGGNIPIDTLCALEFLPQNRRFMLALLSIFQPLGVIITSVLAYCFIPHFSCSPNFSEKDALPSCSQVVAGQPCCTKASNMGWRYLMFTTGAFTLSVFFVRFFIFNFQESPKFLVSRGQDDEAIKALEHIAKVNKRVCGLSKQDFDALALDDLKHDFKPTSSSADHAIGRSTGVKIVAMRKLKAALANVKLLFSDRQTTFVTILMWLTYIMDFWGFTLAGYYLPTILALKNAMLNKDLEFTYRSYIAIYAPGIVAVVLGALMYRVPNIGRKWTMVISSALMGISNFLFSAAKTSASNIGLNVMEYFFQSTFNAVLYAVTPELFATPIRGTACGMASFWGRLASILAPIITQSLVPSQTKLDDAAANYILYLAGGVTLGCVITLSLLPSSRIGQPTM